LALWLSSLSVLFIPAKSEGCCSVTLDLPDPKEQTQWIRDLIMPEIKEWSKLALVGAGGIWALSSFKK
jgi:hypothetical protein